MNWFKKSPEIRYMVLLQYARVVTPEHATREVFEYLQSQKKLDEDSQKALYEYTAIFVECGHSQALSVSDALGLTIHEKRALQLCKLEHFKNKTALASMLSDEKTRQAVMDPEGLVREKIKVVLRASVERLASKRYFNG